MKRKYKILIVDDEANIADTLAAILEQNGCEARAVYSGQQALAIAPEIAPDLVISDVMMPGKNGIEIALELQSSFPKCKILLFSGQPSAAEVMLHAHHCDGVWEIMAKPVHPVDLLAKLDGLAA